MSIVVTLCATLIAVIAHHLGLSEAIGNITTRILSCPKCLAFWFTLTVLLYYGCEPFVAIGLSLASSYLSFWVGLPLVWLNKRYGEAWRRLNKKRP